MRIRTAFCSVLAALTIVAGTVGVDARVARAQDNVAADDDADFTHPGPFAGLGFNWQVQGFQGPFRGQDYGNSWGFNGRGGYRFLDWFAAEAIVEYADKFGPNAANAQSDNLSLLSSTVNAKFILPLERFQPYLEAGAGFLYANDGRGFINSVQNRDFGFAGRLGAGIDLYLTKHVSLFVDNSWTMTTDNTQDLYFYSLGGGGRYNWD